MDLSLDLETLDTGAHAAILVAAIAMLVRALGALIERVGKALAERATAHRLAKQTELDHCDDPRHRRSARTRGPGGRIMLRRAAASAMLGARRHRSEPDFPTGARIQLFAPGLTSMAATATAPASRAIGLLARNDGVIVGGARRWVRGSRRSRHGARRVRRRRCIRRELLRGRSDAVRDHPRAFSDRSQGALHRRCHDADRRRLLRRVPDARPGHSARDP